MIRVVMLDLGDTLTDGTQLFPFVPQCLQAFSRFTNAEGEPIGLGLVSDFHLADPFTEDRVASVFSDYVEILENLELREHFEPIELRVTLSTHVNAFKPDPIVFKEALARLGSDTNFDECIFITENLDHIAACAALGMTTMHFGEGTQDTEGFVDWPVGLVKIARAITPDMTANLDIALGVLAEARLGLENLHIMQPGERRPALATAQKWVPIEDPELGELDGVRVQLPVSVNVTELSDGDYTLELAQEPTPSDVEEARQYVMSLQQNRQIETSEKSPVGRASHFVDTDTSGQRKLKRRGFQAGRV